MIKNRCPICYNDTLTRVGDERWLNDSEAYCLMHCDVCQTCFTYPLPDDAFLFKFYSETFNYQWYSDHLVAKLRDAEMRYAEYQPLLKGGILDFGGGLGYFSQTCRSHGHKSVTYDPYASNTTTTEKWDTLIALHVLEHGNNPDDLIKKMKNLLNPAGQLILAVPNYAGLGYSKQGMGWVWAQPPFIHVFHFSAKSLCILLERHGFSNIKISYHERWDANIWCDADHVKTFKFFDGAWARQPFKSVPLLRKALARFNSYRRFRGLKKSLQKRENQAEFLSELQVSAVAPEASR